MAIVLLHFFMPKGQYAFVLSMTNGCNVFVISIAHWCICSTNLYDTLVSMLLSSLGHTGLYAFVLSKTHWYICFRYLHDTLVSMFQTFRWHTGLYAFVLSMIQWWLDFRGLYDTLVSAFVHFMTHRSQSFRLLYDTLFFMLSSLLCFHHLYDTLVYRDSSFLSFRHPYDTIVITLSRPYKTVLAMVIALHYLTEWQLFTSYTPTQTFKSQKTVKI